MAFEQTQQTALHYLKKKKKKSGEDEEEPWTIMLLGKHTNHLASLTSKYILYANLLIVLEIKHESSVIKLKRTQVQPEHGQIICSESYSLHSTWIAPSNIIFIL